jgi:ketosteroid isomerase-like protein
MSLALRDGRPIGGDGVTQQKAVVEKYTDGFRRGDLTQIVSCLTDDVVWALHGAKTLVGKDAFAAEADSGDGPNPELTLDRLIVGAPPALRGGEGDTVAVIGHGSVSPGGDPHDFVYSEVFTFTDGLVRRLDTFHIWLGEAPA